MSFGDWFRTQQPALPPAEDPEAQARFAEEEALIEKLAEKVVRWQATVPAIMALETVKPLNFIGSQAMIFLEPFVQTLFNLKDYETFRVMMEKRENVERLLLKIEEFDARAQERQREAKAARRAARLAESSRRRRWWWPFGSRVTPPSEPPEK